MKANPKVNSAFKPSQQYVLSTRKLSFPVGAEESSATHTNLENPYKTLYSPREPETRKTLLNPIKLKP